MILISCPWRVGHDAPHPSFARRRSRRQAGPRPICRRKPATAVHADAAEGAFSGATGSTGLDPEAFEAVVDAIAGESGQVHGGEHHGEVFVAVSEIMFALIHYCREADFLLDA
jgi:hypothetical protein